MDRYNLFYFILFIVANTMCVAIHWPKVNTDQAPLYLRTYHHTNLGKFERVRAKNTKKGKTQLTQSWHIKLILSN